MTRTKAKQAEEAIGYTLGQVSKLSGLSVRRIREIKEVIRTRTRAKQAREIIGYTLDEASKVSGLPVKRIQEIEEGDKALWSEMVALSKAYHVEALDLVESEIPRIHTVDGVVYMGGFLCAVYGLAASCVGY